MSDDEDFDQDDDEDDADDDNLFEPRRDIRAPEELDEDEDFDDAAAPGGACDNNKTPSQTAQRLASAQ